jgi:hypothetical protein
MPFQLFSFPQVVRDLGLTLTDTDLFAPVPPITVRPDLLAQVIGGATSPARSIPKRPAPSS